MAIDPVCGMEVDPQEAVEYEDYAGKTYYFCSIPCSEKFEADPARYAGETSGGDSKRPPAA